jgi:hypothetical protein
VLSEPRRLTSLELDVVVVVVGLLVVVLLL